MSRWVQAVGACALFAGAMAMWGQVEDKAPPFGTLENGIYHNFLTGIQFNVPGDWTIVSQHWSTEGAQTVMLRDTVTNVVAVAWLKARKANPADIPAILDHRLDSKLMQRNNFEGYKYRPQSVQHTTIGGQPALSGVADYVRAGQARVEYFTWIDGEKSRVVFSARMPAPELAAFQPRFEDLIQSAMVP